MKMCLECGVAKCTRPRGLCWACYYDPDVKGRYRVSMLFGPKDWPVYTGRPSAEATQAVPGSLEKIMVLQSRASQGVDLHHEWDATFASIANGLPD